MEEMKKTINSSHRSPISKNYNGTMDVLKLLFTIVVFLFHTFEFLDYEEYFPNGATAVEFFFILSGYFMAVSVSRLKPLKENELGKETLRFAIGKIKGILPCYLFAYVLSLSVYLFYYTKETHTTEEILMRLGRILPNFLLLSTTGVDQADVLGLSWYISAMVIGMMVLYPLLRKYKDMFLHVIAPMFAILVGGYMSQKFSGLFLSYTIDFVFSRAVYRGLVGLCVGCFVYTASEKLKEFKFTKFAKIMLNVIEYNLYFWVFYAMMHFNRNFVFIQMILLFFAMSITASRQGIAARIFDNKYVKSTNKLSLALFLCHSSCRQVYMKGEFDLTTDEIRNKFWILTLIATIACLIVTSLCSAFYAKYKDKMKSCFVVPRKSRPKQIENN